MTYLLYSSLPRAAAAATKDYTCHELGSHEPIGTHQYIFTGCRSAGKPPCSSTLLTLTLGELEERRQMAALGADDGGVLLVEQILAGHIAIARSGNVVLDHNRAVGAACRQRFKSPTTSLHVRWPRTHCAHTRLYEQPGGANSRSDACSGRSRSPAACKLWLRLAPAVKADRSPRPSARPGDASQHAFRHASDARAAVERREARDRLAADWCAIGQFFRINAKLPCGAPPHQPHSHPPRTPSLSRFDLAARPVARACPRTIRLRPGRPAAAAIAAKSRSGGARRWVTRTDWPPDATRSATHAICNP